MLGHRGLGRPDLEAAPICGAAFAPATALYGASAFMTLFTTERRYVSCRSSLAEIERRLADPTRRGPVIPVGRGRVAR